MGGTSLQTWQNSHIPPGINENIQHMNVFQTESMAATEQPSFDLSDPKKLKSSNLNNLFSAFNI